MNLQFAICNFLLMMWLNLYKAMTLLSGASGWGKKAGSQRSHSGLT